MGQPADPPENGGETKMDELGIEPKAFRMRNGRSTTELHAHVCGNIYVHCISISNSLRGKLRRPGIEPGSIPWEGTIMPLDHRRDGQVFEVFFFLQKLGDYVVRKTFRCRGSNPGLVGESHLFCHYTTSERKYHRLDRNANTVRSPARTRNRTPDLLSVSKESYHWTIRAFRRTER